MIARLSPLCWSVPAGNGPRAGRTYWAIFIVYKQLPLETEWVDSLLTKLAS
ncbi:MAG: hypothetical protein ACTXOO_04990 [Sodalis sp. (in: enterobacteria)]